MCAGAFLRRVRTRTRRQSVGSWYVYHLPAYAKTDHYASTLRVLASSILPSYARRVRQNGVRTGGWVVDHSAVPHDHHRPKPVLGRQKNMRLRVYIHNLHNNLHSGHMQPDDLCL